MYVFMYVCVSVRIHTAHATGSRFSHQRCDEWIEMGWDEMGSMDVVGRELNGTVARVRSLCYLFFAFFSLLYLSVRSWSCLHSTTICAAAATTCSVIS